MSLSHTLFAALGIVLTATHANAQKDLTPAVFDLQQRYDLWPSDGKLLVQDIFDLAKAKATYPACFTAWEREKMAGGMTMAQADTWIMGMTLFEAAYFDALWTGVAANPAVGSRGYCGSRNKIIIPQGAYYTRDQLDYAFGDIGGIGSAYGATELHLWNEMWRGNDTDRVLLGAYIDGSGGTYSYLEGTNIHDLRLVGEAPKMKDPKRTITGLRAWSFGCGSNVRNIFITNCDIGLDCVVGTPFTGSGYIGVFECNVAGIALSGAAGATISFETVESDDCPTLFLIRPGVTGANKGMPSGALLNVQTTKIEWAISPPSVRTYKPEIIMDGSGWIRANFGTISYASGNVFSDALFAVKGNVNTSSIHVDNLKVWAGDNVAAILHDDIAKTTWLYDNGWRSSITTFDWYSDGVSSQFRSWPTMAKSVPAPHQGRLGYLQGDPVTGRPIGAFDRVAGTPRWDNVTGSSTAPVTPPVEPPVVPPVVPPVTPPVSDTIAYFTFDAVSKSNITATVGKGMRAIYSVGAMAGGVLDNSGSAYVNYASYPVQWDSVRKVTLQGFTADKHGGVLMSDSTGEQYLLIKDDGSVIERLPGYVTHEILPKGSVKFDGTKRDLVLALPVPLSVQFFCQRTGQGGVWRGAMEGLLIQ